MWMIGFGLDLSGYTTNGSSLVAVVSNGVLAKAVVLRNSAFAGGRSLTNRVLETTEAEAVDLKKCLDIGPVAVDVPIDLQNLPFSGEAEFLWELTRRPIDKALNAMPPFADRIGAPVARFSAILRRGNLRSRLGKNLFETYPSENFRRLGQGNDGERVSRHVAREEFCRKYTLDVSANSPDDLDALVCGIAAVAPEGDLLSSKEFHLDRGEIPTGFRILRRNPFERILLKQQDFSTWMAEQKATTSG
jgi:hypothetical protein